MRVTLRIATLIGAAMVTACSSEVGHELVGKWELERSSNDLACNVMTPLTITAKTIESPRVLIVIDRIIKDGNRWFVVDQADKSRTMFSKVTKGSLVLDPLGSGGVECLMKRVA